VILDTRDRHFDAHLATECVEKIDEAIAVVHFRVHTNRSQYLLHFSADSNVIKNITYPQKYAFSDGKFRAHPCSKSHASPRKHLSMRNFLTAPLR
jgi:hypothetical protein